MAKKQSLKLPPQNIEAEQAVLGALMLDNKAIIQIADILKPDDFYQNHHKKIYEVILKLYGKNQPIDILSVTTQLKENNAVKEVGGSSYLAKLIESVPSSFHINYYTKIVKEKKTLRDLINTAGEINEKVFGAAGDLEDILDDIEKRIFAISQHSIQQKFVPIREELHDAYERIEKLTQGKGGLRGIGSGFKELDNYLSGFQKADLITLGARPSLGKTSFALDIARHIAIKEKKSVGIFSLEMSRDQVIDRLIAAESQVPLWYLRTGKIKDENDFESLRGALDRLSHTHIYIDDTPSPNVLQMRSMARRLQAENGLDILFIDYLQLIQPRMPSDSMVQQITEISRSLKSLARELNIPIMAVSQLSRAVDQRELKIPRLSDLRESGSIEQDSDVVLFIYRKDKYKNNINPEEENIAEIIISKHRNGPTGSIKLYFDSERVSFRSLDNIHAA